MANFDSSKWFPAATVVQWLLNYHPAGKFSLPNSVLNLNGRFAWCVMEVVGPINMIYILSTLPAQVNFSFTDLPLWNKLAAALYVIHYFNRSIMNPLFVAPSISPVRLEVFLLAFIFNWFNSSCIAGWIAGYDLTQRLGYTPLPASSTILHQCLPYIGLATFAYGMIGNIRAERTLWSLRREEAQRRASKKLDSKDGECEKNIYHKVYVIPPAKGLFRWVLYPHYALEWLEWLGFVLVGTAVYPAHAFLPAISNPGLPAPSVAPAPWLRPFAMLAEHFRLPFPGPALVFVLNNVFTMLPQARRGWRWYNTNFGKDAVAGRSAVIPGVPFL
ncbi:3-oxo-5-alpha-steroid 4-dehydrogenase family protein [Talaromyces stipitatus ATCC 10500]|uniref:3-oxo-5-alpha-steroid 4-dehydrogenase family protein n=1 Tax=Talaromyces stipitatus (strain ATCC 10500 / CBS 375.48 / QM 6759 / NRRL 1006) TaxID=441959 RepID=B8LTX6_TALSN|nr:3-oxo-5-alpha-steroid 4-dehydrogenase family protein [Talaromyces stipitatus ATCC 10500]EED23806.1 3-oxo-5-alpha-steroid 4-dehydrogenase family protein [Talaromyces stipitatus ATCC 10500]